jgi:hypothetical protein
MHRQVKFTTLSLVLLGFALGLAFNSKAISARVAGTRLGGATINLEKEKIGKLFIKAAPVAEGEFADPKLEDTVKDLKKNSGNFVLVNDEAEADFLIIVLERKNELRSPAGTVVNNKIVVGTLSVKEGGKWKPAIKLEHGGGNFWELAAHRVVEDVEKWIKANVKKQ